MRVCVCISRVRVFLLKQTTALHLTSFADGVFKEWRHYYEYYHMLVMAPQQLDHAAAKLAEKPRAPRV